MKKTLLFAALTAVLFSPMLASAHERGVFEIGGGFYQFVIGSQNEPVVVDDKTGLDFRVTKLASATATSGTPVTGLEQTLKVELSAGGQKREQKITTVYGQVGAYNSLFYPTSADTLSYRIFGSVDSNPVNLSFTCHAGEHVMSGMAPDTVVKDMGGGVKRHMQAGMFTCPMEKEKLGFPVASVHVADLASLAGTVAMQKEILTKVAREFHFVEIALGFLAVALAVVSLRRKPRPQVP